MTSSLDNAMISSVLDMIHAVAEAAWLKVGSQIISKKSTVVKSIDTKHRTLVISTISAKRVRQYMVSKFSNHQYATDLEI